MAGMTVQGTAGNRRLCADRYRQKFFQGEFLALQVGSRRLFKKIFISDHTKAAESV
jgi:hypothetical protein